MRTLAHKSRKENEMTKKEYFYQETGKHIRNVQVILDAMICDLIQQARNHDASKYDAIEADLFAEVTPELSKTEYGSEAYRATLQKIKPAIDHHNQVNFHHPEHYLAGIQGMTIVDLVEMIADWIAASKRNKNGDVFDSIEKNQKRFGYSDDLKQIMKNTCHRYTRYMEIMEEHNKYIGE